MHRARLSYGKQGAGLQPLVLDRVLARQLQSLTQTLGRETGHDPDGPIASWAWRDENCSPHRYAVYLSSMQAAAGQAAATGT
ncbi:8-oxoguanine DNA glycosylase OGG fold protein [Streptomyces phaeofaciens]|uniref:8-oxoguanine DNA glycosylase OGG fold protein n=1 Tax=Streptomyces phaeofaciens TaxID=68254 RepID=UPI003570CF11